MRIVTRPDFDGIVCAVLLLEALDPDMDILWLEPGQIQAGQATGIQAGDILANLPCHPGAALWFDHHVSNKPATPVPGAFDIAPSAAGVVYTYYRARGQLDNRFDELVEQTDIIDSAALTREQVNTPENYPYILLSMTIQNREFEDIPYWCHLVDLLRHQPIDRIMADPQVNKRCMNVVKENQAFGGHLKAHTTIDGHISITDFRGLDPVPHGNRFLTYSLFADTAVSMKIRYKTPARNEVLVSVGRSIFNEGCKVNIGNMLSGFGGGGHAGAGGCTLAADQAQVSIDRIIEILKANQPG